MIHVTPQMRIRVALDPVDVRPGIDGQCRLCLADLKEDPFRGAALTDRGAVRSPCDPPRDESSETASMPRTPVFPAIGGHRAAAPRRLGLR